MLFSNNKNWLAPALLIAVFALGIGACVKKISTSRP